MAKTFNNIYTGMVTFESLYHAYLRARRGKRKSWPCRHFEKILEGNLIKLEKELLDGTYECGGYRSFYVTEPKLRKITALKLFRDRVVQNAVVASINPIWECRFIHDSYACRVGKGTHAGAGRAQEMLRDCKNKHGKVYVLKADISKYFASVDHDILVTLLRKRISDKRLMNVLEKTIKSYSEGGGGTRGIPIGNLTSQLFANIYMDAFDQWVKCRKLEKYYVRYVDDFIIVHHDKSHLQKMRLECEEWLGCNLNLKTNHKTSVFPVATLRGQGLDFLGFHLWVSHRRLRKGNIKRFGRQLKSWSAAYSEFEIDLIDIREQLHSWVNHAKHGDAMPLVSKMLEDTIFRRNYDCKRDGIFRGNSPRRDSSRNPRRVGSKKTSRIPESNSLPS